jgi:hypothetical protein
MSSCTGPGFGGGGLGRSLSDYLRHTGQKQRGCQRRAEHLHARLAMAFRQLFSLRVELCNEHAKKTDADLTRGGPLSFPANRKPGKLETEGTFTNFQSPKNWETFLLSPGLISAQIYPALINGRFRHQAG